MANKSTLDNLIEVYQQAQLKLVKIITSPNTGAGTKTYYNTVLKKLEKLMQELQNQTNRYINTEIPKEYKQALDDTYDYFKRNNLLMKQPSMFAQIHSDAVYELSREMQFHINQGLSIAGRRVMRYLDISRDNVLRQQGLMSSAVKIASKQTVKNMQADLIERLSKNGFLTVQYGSGERAYQVGLDTYTAMVSRSTTREAGNLARENQLIENGYDLMKMTEHYPTCSKCATLQGRVYSISGTDERFPPLSTAFSSGYKNVHPNCRHVMTYYVESMMSDEELSADIKRSNQPFIDPRSDAHKADYSKTQADNRRMRADRSQYERYKARLGDDAPKSFHSFRKIKKTDGDEWQKLQKSYRENYDKSVDKSGKSGIIESELGRFKQRLRSDENIDKEYYSTLKERFSHGSDNAKKAFNKYVPENSIADSQFWGTAHYDTNAKKISMHYGYDLNNDRGAGATWFHEHGHLIDDFAGRISNNDDFHKLLIDDYFEHIKKYKNEHGLNTLEKVYAEIGKDVGNMREHSAVSDLLNAISKDKIKGAATHDPEYWLKSSDRLTSETFAHMFEAQFDEIRYKEMQKYFPNALQKFESMLGGII